MDDATGPLGVFVAAGRKRGALVPDDGTLLALLGQHAALLLRAAGQTSRHLAAAGRLSKLLRGAPRMCASGVQLEAVAARTLPCELPILMVPSLGGTLESQSKTALPERFFAGVHDLLVGGFPCLGVVFTI